MKYRCPPPFFLQEILMSKSTINWTEISGCALGILLFLALTGAMVWGGIQSSNREINLSGYTSIRKMVNDNNDLKPFVEEYMKKGKITVYEYRRLDSINDSLLKEKQKSMIFNGETKP